MNGGFLLGVQIDAISRRAVANALLSIRAVHYSEGEPFVFTSGTESPVYVDCRKLISYPAQRDTAMAVAEQWIRSSNQSFDVLAGGETAGIPYAAFLADRLRLPMIYVRKRPKEFGTRSRVEGVVQDGAKALLVEDLIFDSYSKLSFAEALRESGACVNHTLVIFEYGRPDARSAMAKEGIELTSLTSWAELLETSLHVNYFSPQQVAKIREFLHSQWLKGKADVSQASSSGT
jgi:orotate phosphoribosyltransferase